MDTITEVLNDTAFARYDGGFSIQTSDEIGAVIQGWWITNPLAVAEMLVQGIASCVGGVPAESVDVYNVEFSPGGIARRRLKARGVTRILQVSWGIYISYVIHVPEVLAAQHGLSAQHIADSIAGSGAQALEEACGDMLGYSLDGTMTLVSAAIPAASIVEQEYVPGVAPVAIPSAEAALVPETLDTGPSTASGSIIAVTGGLFCVCICGFGTLRYIWRKKKHVKGCHVDWETHSTNEAHHLHVMKAGFLSGVQAPELAGQVGCRSVMRDEVSHRNLELPMAQQGTLSHVVNFEVLLEEPEAENAPSDLASASSEDEAGNQISVGSGESQAGRVVERSRQIHQQNQAQGGQTSVSFQLAAAGLVAKIRQHCSEEGEDGLEQVCQHHPEQRAETPSGQEAVETTGQQCQTRCEKSSFQAVEVAQMQRPRHGHALGSVREALGVQHLDVHADGDGSVDYSASNPPQDDNIVYRGSI